MSSHGLFENRHERTAGGLPAKVVLELVATSVAFEKLQEGLDPGSELWCEYDLPGEAGARSALWCEYGLFGESWVSPCSREAGRDED
jgi:hypothetical protein